MTMEYAILDEDDWPVLFGCLDTVPEGAASQ